MSQNKVQAAEKKLKKAIKGKKYAKKKSNAKKVTYKDEKKTIVLVKDDTYDPTKMYGPTLYFTKMSLNPAHCQNSARTVSSNKAFGLSQYNYATYEGVTDCNIYVIDGTEVNIKHICMFIVYGNWNKVGMSDPVDISDTNAARIGFIPYSTAGNPILEKFDIVDTNYAVPCFPLVNTDLIDDTTQSVQLGGGCIRLQSPVEFTTDSTGQFVTMFYGSQVKYGDLYRNLGSGMSFTDLMSLMSGSKPYYKEYPNKDGVSVAYDYYQSSVIQTRFYDKNMVGLQVGSGEFDQSSALLDNTSLNAGICVASFNQEIIPDALVTSEDFEILKQFRLRFSDQLQAQYNIRDKTKARRYDMNDLKTDECPQLMKDKLFEKEQRDFAHEYNLSDIDLKYIVRLSAYSRVQVVPEFSNWRDYVDMDFREHARLNKFKHNDYIKEHRLHRFAKGRLGADILINYALPLRTYLYFNLDTAMQMPSSFSPTNTFTDMHFQAYYDYMSRQRMKTYLPVSDGHSFLDFVDHLGKTINKYVPIARDVTSDLGTLIKSAGVGKRRRKR